MYKIALCWFKIIIIHGYLSTLGHHQAETNKIGRPLCETPRTHGQRDDTVGTNAWEEVQGKRYCHGSCLTAI